MMKPILTARDLEVLAGAAGLGFAAIPSEYAFQGTTKPLDDRQRRALAWLRAALMLLNSKGAIRPEFVAAYEEPLVVPDSDPDADFADWVEEEAPRK